MAALIKVSYKGWQRYEAGDNIPGGNVLQSLAKLGFNTNWILTGKGEMYITESEFTYNINTVNTDNIVSEVQEPYSMPVPGLQPVYDAFTEVMSSNDEDTKLALTQNVFTFQKTVRFGKEIAEIKRDMDAIKRRLFTDPREDDFKTLESPGEKIKAGGGNGE